MIYPGAPNLRDNFVVRLQEKGEVDIPVDLRQDPPAFPEPTDFTWTRNGLTLRSGLTSTYSSVTFNSVVRSDAGNYTVTATNFLLNDSSRPIGSDPGSFYLDVLCKFLFVYIFTSPMRYYLLRLSRPPLLCNRRSHTALCSVG